MRCKGAYDDSSRLIKSKLARLAGAIGSEYKVDASYLSPNVNTASRLEAATKQFGLPLLFSDHFARLLSPGVRATCRQVDRVTVKGSAQPLGLWTFDADPELIATPNLDSLPSGRGSTFSTSSTLDDDDAPVGAEELGSHPDVLRMRATLPGGDGGAAFLERFRAGYTAYAEGRWQEAREALNGTLQARKGPGDVSVVDGPSKALLGYMEAHAFKAPATWQARPRALRVMAWLFVRPLTDASVCACAGVPRADGEVKGRSDPHA